MSNDKQARVYALDERQLPQEQMAVVFAMTSRSPDPFDEIARRVSEEKAADFHERWVLDYGHASVAEHAVVHLAVENISRVACDTLENNRLASYTEKSSRYQVIGQGDFHAPEELEPGSELLKLYTRVCNRLFREYENLLSHSMEWLGRKHEREEKETKQAYNLRMRRMATDACRNVLPASILTNVGVTANARTLEHAISKLMSSEISETKALGLVIREQGRNITPTLIKYASENPQLREKRITAPLEEPEDERQRQADLVEFDPHAVLKLATAILYRNSGTDYADASIAADKMGEGGQLDLIRQAVAGMGPHDALPREFETVDYTVEFTMDYGALREFQRHRMMTTLRQPLGVRLGIRVPTLMQKNGTEEQFVRATEEAAGLHRRMAEEIGPEAAQYAVTHAHLQRVAAKMNLRELHHIIRLRTSHRAHEAIRGPVAEAAELVRRVHPGLSEALTAGG